MTELDPAPIRDLQDLNTRLWAWLEAVYHDSAHAGLAGQTPLARYQQDLARIRTLGQLAARLDELFYHRIHRKVRKDATVSYLGQRFEVAYELSGQTLVVVIDPHGGRVLGVEDANGQSLGPATPLDPVANAHRPRRKPNPTAPLPQRAPTTLNAVELAHQRYYTGSDEAQNLPLEFLRDLPAFLNFAFDSRNLMTVWLLAHPQLAQTLDRAPYAALASRIQLRLQLHPIVERDSFRSLITHALELAGCQHTILSDPGFELLRQASQGLPRQAARLLKTSMQLAVHNGLNHLPDALIQQAIEELT